MSLQFRHATEADLPRIVEIYNTTIAGRMVTADTAPVTVESRLPWFHAHNSTHRPLWMIDDDGSNVGWMSFQSFYGRPAYNGTVEVSIYLDETARGKGLGKKILQHAITVAPEFGVQTLLGFIFAHNEPSLKLFMNMGFEEWAHLPEIAVLDGVERSLKILGRKI
ncbi:phosphinothricin acetyltransferase [Chitinophaga ginsengisegetis]|uniref:Phosphinothricin acetyltransferase n=1 Tax=Chitinophaga ginsengisegetis TaxID=393003 RepID=A0A1T5N4P1_9BACT|nr:GNAT family N-acetyltransferase [Chitinophaga ginsengisegetis]MDR6571227.1 phosphinothricin acetyltransferase [Chitinophaga ginsengisegetis]MDR6650935.1 phosphinothricin acetyltransferase [Chitinophaga ginsengisegetis]MDR6657311.1 phosphinothricin acetyltransferase [Chitinophaga ginsengisegetis]SKC95417.1 phosphinothricin acetyltransferase [Chitinophaga ginsengisegetis]